MLAWGGSTAADPHLVTGLLQTSDYARAIIGGGSLPACEVEARVLVRMGRRDVVLRSYRGDLRDFARFFTGPIERITTGVLRAYLRGLADKAPATRARREAALASLLAWAYRAEMIAANPMTRLDRTHLPVSPPHPVPTEHIEAVLRAIPKTRDRDRLLFLLLYTTGMRVGEALTIDVDDLELRRDDEHVTVWGKGGAERSPDTRTVDLPRFWSVSVSGMCSPVMR